MAIVAGRTRLRVMGFNNRSLMHRHAGGSSVRSLTGGDGRWRENRPSTRWLPPLDIRELWAYRELAFFLALRDLQLRYKQTAIGVGWVVLQPLVAAGIFALILGRVAGLPSDGFPYAVFVYTGLIIWTYFAKSVESAANSLVENVDLVTKVYFPRLLAPLSAVVPGLVDLGISVIILGALVAIYGVVPPVALVVLPAVILAAAVVALGAGLWLAAINVKYRDVRHALSFLLQVWLFASPVIYPSSLVHGDWRYLYAANPMASVIDAFRWSALGAPAPGAEGFISLGVAALLLASGVAYFLRTERWFADII
jgi:lipopolysaccharide transport system permease protein